jgi:hypothetical protein
MLNCLISIREGCIPRPIDLESAFITLYAFGQTTLYSNPSNRMSILKSDPLHEGLALYQGETSIIRVEQE